MNNKITQSDRACVNCRHLKRNWGPVGLLDWAIAKVINKHHEAHIHYRCKVQKPVVMINNITGVYQELEKTVSCASMRTFLSCEETGELWEPSDAWCNDPDNLFKIITNPINKETDS
jgi:hypothetical protein